MFYCSWPVGTSHTCGWPLQYQLMSKHCTAMKQYHDVQDTWGSIMTIIECRTPNFPGQRIAREADERAIGEADASPLGRRADIADIDG